MAKRKRKKRKNQAVLKYEVYGILTIIFSVISLAGKGSLPGLGSVGRSLSYMTFFLMGQLYFAIPLFFIFIGFQTMIRRRLSQSWSSRMSGILLAVTAFAVLFHIQLIERMFPNTAISYGQVLAEPYHNLSALLSSALAPADVHDFKDGLGGGFVGAVFSVLFTFLFGTIGARLIVYALFAIGFIYITGLSYVQIGQKIKKGVAGFFKLLIARLAEIYTLLMRKRTSSKQRKRLRRAAVPLPIEEDIHEEMPPPARRSKKKPLFMQLLSEDPEQEERQEAEQAEEYRVTRADLFDEKPAPQAGEAEQGELFIRDFHDHVDARPAESEAVRAASNEGDSPASAEADLAFHEAKSEHAAPYLLPPFHLLKKPPQAKGERLDFKANARKLEATLESFGVRAKVLEIVRGPAVTRYEIQPDVGVKVSRIVGLTDDIALALAARDLRMEAPIPGKAAIGIEVPNAEIAMVTMREVMESSAFHESSSKMSIVLGRDISGQPIVANLAKMPHLLVAGATGSGKSVCINGIITSVLYKAKPDEVKFLMIDPKMVELNVYNGIPHLLAPVVTDPRRASLALKKVVSEMEKRYELFSKSGTRNIEGYNTAIASRGEAPLPYIVVIVDELADLMMVAANDVEDAICRLAQMARAAGIHLIIATQRPSVDVITGLIKANIPSRIAFGVSSQIDSRTILDMAGAEKLLGRGDMLFMPVGASKPVRVQGAFVSDQEVEAIVDYVSSQEKAEYREELVPQVEEQSGQDGEPLDGLYDQAVQIVLEAKQASVSLLQRRLRIGYTRAARLIDSMEATGVVGPYEGSKPREVLITMEQFQESK